MPDILMLQFCDENKIFNIQKKSDQVEIFKQEDTKLVFNYLQLTSPEN